MIVKSQFLVFADVLPREDADHCLLEDGPLTRDAIRVTGVVDEAGHVPVVGRVDNLAVVRAHHIRASGVFVHFLSLFTELRIYIEDFANVLHHEGAFGDSFASSETPALLRGLDGVDVSVLVQLKSAVLTSIANRTHLGHAVLAD